MPNPVLRILYMRHYHIFVGLYGIEKECVFFPMGSTVILQCTLSKGRCLAMLAPEHTREQIVIQRSIIPPLPPTSFAEGVDFFHPFCGAKYSPLYTHPAT